MFAKSKAARKERAARISSMIECRACLDPATKRHCCGSFYCDMCYFNDSKVGRCSVVVVPKTVEATCGYST